MDQSRILLLKRLFTNVSKYETDLLKIFDKNFIKKYKDTERCDQYKLFKKRELLGSGQTSSGVLACLDDTCIDFFVIKMTLIDFKSYKLIKSPFDELRPENIDIQIQSKVNKVLSKFNDNFQFPHYLEIITTFMCNTCINKKFKNFVIRYGSENIFDHENKDDDKVDDHYYRVTFMEFAPRGTFDTYLHAFECNDNIAKNIIFQVIMVRAYLEKYYPDFKHNDMHSGNILLKNRNDPLNYEIDGKKYSISKPIFSAIISDFDYSSDNEFYNEKLIYHYLDSDFKMENVTSFSDICRFLLVLYSLIIHDKLDWKYINTIKFIKDVIPEILIKPFLLGYDKTEKKIKELTAKEYYERDNNLMIILGGNIVNEDALRFLNIDFKDKTALKLIDHPYFSEFRI